MKKGDTKKFTNKPLLYELVNLRRNGCAISTLAIYFNCDESSVRHQLNKYSITPLVEVYCMETILSKILPDPKPEQWKVVNGERINLGKNYADYKQA